MRASTYADHLIGQGLRPNTVRNYRRELERATAWFDQRGLDLRHVTPAQVAEYAETRPNTSSIRSHLRSALTWWWDWQGVTGWPKAVPVPSQGPMVCKALDPGDAALIVKAAVGWWRPGTAVLVGAYLGFRNHEIAGLRWDAFDPNMEWAKIVGKGGRTRTVAVHPVLGDQLAGRRNGSPYVFEGRFSGHVTHATVCNWVKEVASAAGIVEDVWPHRLRHTFGATANDNTGDLRSVQEAMGHARPETTAGYTRATARRLRGVSDSLDYLGDAG